MQNLALGYPAVEREIREARVRAARRSAEAELVKAAQRYRALFDNSPLPTWVCERDSSLLLAVNAAAMRHYGYSAEVTDHGRGDASDEWQATVGATCTAQTSNEGIVHVGLHRQFHRAPRHFGFRNRVFGETNHASVLVTQGARSAERLARSQSRAEPPGSRGSGLPDARDLILPRTNQLVLGPSTPARRQPAERSPGRPYGRGGSVTWTKRLGMRTFRWARRVRRDVGRGDLQRRQRAAGDR